MTGDIVPHDIWSTTQDDNTKVIQKTSDAILKHFPTATVIPVLGNHETHPVNLYVLYCIRSIQAFGNNNPNNDGKF